MPYGFIIHVRTRQYVAGLQHSSLSLKSTDFRTCKFTSADFNRSVADTVVECRPKIMKLEERCPEDLSLLRFDNHDRLQSSLFNRLFMTIDHA